MSAGYGGMHGFDIGGFQSELGIMFLGQSLVLEHHDPNPVLVQDRIGLRSVYIDVANLKSQAVDK
jgi:hypothetical protein